MKKSISILLAIMNIFIMSTAFAIDIDLKSYNDQEIIMLLELVNEEIVERKIEKAAQLPKGSYLIGRDSPEGQYIFTPTGGSDEFCIFSIYENEEIWKTKKERPRYETVRMEGQIFLALEEGNILESPNMFILTIESGPLFY